MDPLRAHLPLIAAAIIAGGLDITIKCPFDRLKTKMQGQGSGGEGGEPRPGVAAHLASTFRAGGVAALWSGYGATLVRDLPYLVIKWCATKRAHCSSHPAHHAPAGPCRVMRRRVVYHAGPHLQGVLRRRVVYLQMKTLLGQSNQMNLISGAIAGAVAATSVTPADVVKTRLQIAKVKRPVHVIIRDVVREGGVGALFTGIVPRLARIPIYTAVTLATFDWIKNEFLRATI